MSRNARNTRFFWGMLLLLFVAIYFAVMFVSTVDSCGKGAKSWQWAPPRWVCTRGF